MLAPENSRHVDELALAQRQRHRADSAGAPGPAEHHDDGADGQERAWLPRITAPRMIRIGSSGMVMKLSTTSITTRS